MDLTPYLANLRQDLAAAAGAADESTQRAAKLLAGAIEPAARLALMNAMSDMAAEITAEFPERTVDVRLNGRGVRMVVETRSAEAEPEPGPRQPTSADSNGDVSRITVRMLEEIKVKAEEAAAAQGRSLNSYVCRAVQGALAGKQTKQDGEHDNGASMPGWAQ